MKSILKAGRPSAKKSKLIEAVQVNDGEQIVKASFNFPKSLHRSIKRAAMDKDITLTQFVMNALLEYVKK